MTREELIEILKTGLDEQEIQDLNIGKLVKLPGAKGCIKLNNEWFVYGSQDERGNISFNGPFDDSALIYAIAKIFCKIPFKICPVYSGILFKASFKLSKGFSCVVK